MFEIPYDKTIHFLLIMIRISSFILIAPFWSNTSISAKIKIGLSCLISLIIMPFISPVSPLPETMSAFIFLVIKQIFLGLFLGFISKLFIEGIRTASAILDIQIGFAFGKVLDPAFGAQSSVVELFYSLTTIIILLCTRGHLLILKAIMQTFSLLPLDGNISISGSFAENIIVMTGQIFIITLEMAGPIIGVLFLIEICMAIMAKMIPQMNVFMVELPLKMAAGIICIVFTLPFFPRMVSSLVEKMLEQFLFMAKSIQ